MVDNRLLKTCNLPEHAVSVEANTQILRDIYLHSHCEVKRVWDNVMVQKYTGFQLGSIGTIVVATVRCMYILKHKVVQSDAELVLY